MYTMETGNLDALCCNDLAKPRPATLQTQVFHVFSSSVRQYLQFRYTWHIKFNIENLILTYMHTLIEFRFFHKLDDMLLSVQICTKCTYQVFC